MRGLGDGSAMRTIGILAAAAVLTAPSLASAEVIERRDDGFVLKQETTVKASPEAVYRALGQIALWWDGAHTYGGSAANLSLALEPGGCFCERLDGGGVEHGRVLMAWPGRTLRLQAALGPLQAMTTDALLTFEITPDGEGSTLTMTYAANGRGLGAVAGPVDGVMSGQFARLARHAAGEAP